MEKYLFQKNTVFDDTILLLRSAQHAVDMLEEAARVGLNCYYSVRRNCWILYDYQPWKLSPELEKAGVKIEKIKNREKDYQDMINATKEFLRDRFYDADEIISSIGEEEYVNYLYIESWDKDRLSDEMATDRESEMSDDQILGYMKRSTKPFIVDLINRYENSSEDGEIIKELRKYTIEFLYDQYYDELDNVFEYLLERGFINTTDDDKIEINNIPNYITFDWDSFINDESGDVHFDQLSDYGQVYRYGGDNPYYMIKIDY